MLRGTIQSRRNSSLIGLEYGERDMTGNCGRLHVRSKLQLFNLTRNNLSDIKYVQKQKD